MKYLNENEGRGQGSLASTGSSALALMAEQGSVKRVDLHQGSSQLPGRGSKQSVKWEGEWC